MSSPNHPVTRWALSPAQKSDARNALRLLEGTELSLTEAARRAVAGRLAVNRVTFAHAADRFLLELVRRKSRGATVRWYENKLAPMLLALGDQMMDAIGRADLLAVGQGQSVTDSTRASYYRAVRAVWRWAKGQEPPMVGADVTEGLPTTPRRDHQKETGILTVADTKAILAGAGRHRGALALMLFAGLRPQEVWGIDKPALLWRHIDPAEQMIRVPAEVAKTRKPRILEGLPPTVWDWLTPGAPDASVSQISSQALIRAAQIAGGFARKKHHQRELLRPWPHDATRHTFATYALALTGDPGKVSLWLGHEGNPRMLYTHYRGLATKAEAEKFFAIRPS
jgi:integrase